MMTNSYWDKRTQDIMDALDNRDSGLTKSMLAEYKKALDDINQKVDEFYQKYADENGLSYDDAVKRIKQTDLDDYVKRANEYRKSVEKNPEALRRLNAQLTTGNLNRMELLKLEIEFRMLQASGKQVGSFTDYLKRESEYVYEQMNFGNTIRTLSEDEIETILQLPWSGANYSTRIWRTNDLLTNKLKDELVRAAINGTNPKVTAKKLRDTFGGTKANTERLVRTESTYVANSTIAKRYNDMGVQQYEFSAHIDSRTSLICRHLNGQVFKMSDFQPGVNAPAMHPNCRSRIVPSDDALSKFDKYLENKSSVDKNLNSIILKNYDKKAADYFSKSIEGASEDTKNALLRGLNDLTTLGTAKGKQVSHFSYYDNAINMDKDSLYGKQNVFAHEIGHKIDAANGVQNKSYWSSDNLSVMEIKRDLNNTLFKGCKNQRERQELMYNMYKDTQQLFDTNQEEYIIKYGGLSDIIGGSGLTGTNRFPLRYGHQASYWGKARDPFKQSVGKELVAHISAAMAESPETLQMWREYLPNITSKVEQMITDYGKGK